MQNKAKFRKVKLNVTDLLTREYEKRTLGGVGKNKAKQTQTKPISKAKKCRSQPFCCGFSVKDYTCNVPYNMVK